MLGLSTAADIDRYVNDVNKRTQIKSNPREYYASEKQNRTAGRQSTGPDRSSLAPFDSEGRKSHDRETTPKLDSTSAPGNSRKRAPLNLANSPSLHLLTPAEQTLCSQLRILPKPYLVVKETLVREYARRGGKLRRREARDLVKIDVNKTSRVWDFLAQAGFLQINAEPTISNPAVAASTTPVPMSVTPSQDPTPGGASALPQPLPPNGSFAASASPVVPPLPGPVIGSSGRQPPGPTAVLQSWTPPQGSV